MCSIYSTLLFEMGTLVSGSLRSRSLLNFTNNATLPNHGDYALQIFPGMLPWENNNAFDVNDYKFWSGPNPWQFIFEGYKSGVAPGKQGVQVGDH